MKRFLSLLFLLSSLASLAGGLSAPADTVGWERMQRVRGDGSTQKGWSRRSTDAYPHTQAGNIAFQNAVNGGQIGIVLVDPTGTVTMPASVTGAAGPGWASARYGLIYNRLAVDVTADVVGLKIDRWDGVTLLGSSPDLGGVSSGQFLTPVAQSGQGEFTKTVRATWMPSVAGISLKLTFKRSSGETYSQYVTPAYGASNVALFTMAAPVTQFAFQIVSYSCQTGVLTVRFVSPDAGSPVAYSIPGLAASSVQPGTVVSFTLPSDQKIGGNYSGSASQNGKQVSISFTTSCELGPTVNPPVTNPPTSTTTAGYSRVLVIGNSILHNTWSGHSWGMAASAPGSDYFHLLTAKFQAISPACEVREVGDSRFNLAYGIVEGSHWEEFYWRLNEPGLDIAQGGLNRYQPLADWKPDLIVMELGDNITDNSHDLAGNYVAFVNKIKSQNTSAKVVVCSPIITNSGTNTILAGVAASQGWPFADMSNVVGRTAGDYNHPNDQGMIGITDQIWAKVPVSTTPVVVTPPTTTTTGAGMLPLLTYTDQGWGSEDERVLQNDYVVVKFSRQVGGGITYISRKPSTENLVNVNIVGDRYDTGRLVAFSTYSSPYNDAFRVNNKQSLGIGANVVQGGNIGFWPDFSYSGIVEKSAIVQTQDRGPVMCLRARGLYWDVSREPGHTVFDIEVWLEGYDVRYICNTTVEERNPVTMPIDQRDFLTAWPQELPCVYGIADLKTKIGVINGQEISLNIPNGLNPKSYITSGRWLGMYSQDLSKGLTLVTPSNAYFGAFQLGESGNWRDFNCAYVALKENVNLDIVGTVQHWGHVIVGSLAEAKAKIAAIPLDNSFDFDFSNENHHWGNQAAPMKRINGNLVLEIGYPHVDNGQTSNYGAIDSPIRGWAATDLATINFTMSVSSGVSQLSFRWLKVTGEGTTQEFSSTFPVIGDGVERTYSVNTATMSGFTGTIVRVGLGAVNGIPADTKVILKRIKKS